MTDKNITFQIDSDTWRNVQILCIKRLGIDPRSFVRAAVEDKLRFFQKQLEEAKMGVNTEGAKQQ